MNKLIGCHRFAVLSLFLVFFLCQKKGEEVTNVARIGTKTITRDAFETFKKMQQMYPHRMSPYFPGRREPISTLVETEVLYPDARQAVSVNSYTSSGDWAWKKRFFPAQLYYSDIIERNGGFTEAEIEEYYEENKEKYTATKKVYDTISVAGDETSDSASKEDSITSRDSTYYQPLTRVKHEILDEMLTKTYPVDEAFSNQLRESDSTIDAATVQREWLRHLQQNRWEFFLEKMYEDAFNKEYSDSQPSWFGKDAVITPEDFQVILQWLPEHQRDRYDTPEKQVPLARYLLFWKLAAEKTSENKAFLNRNNIETLLDYALKIEVVQKYVVQHLVPNAEKLAQIDTGMCRFKYWDERSRVIHPPDSQNLARTLNDQKEKMVSILLDSIIWEARVDEKVEFLQSDWKDDKSENPDMLLEKANTARDSGNTDEAMEFYKKLTVAYPFTLPGKTAFVELAKIQTEKERYSQAIDNYRWYLISSADSASNQCNTFFMIGFIYDEHLDKPALAEANYRWILKNTPDCDLADDAEFMLLHLDEPMTSIEELRAQAIRQGRSVEEEEVVEELDGE